MTQGIELDRRRGVLDYHARTRHDFGRYARSAGYLDWESQPDPFRRYAGARLVRLPLAGDEAGPRFGELYAEAGLPARPLETGSLSLFLRYALSITAWKEAGESRWALRANPSSGNLHPSEGYIILPPLVGVGGEPAVYHYAPLEHALEERAVLSSDGWAGLAAQLPAGAFLVGLTSIHWREAWKYGERAYRYCQHDAGHALGALSYAAAALGWRLRLALGVGDAAIEALLGSAREADRGEAEPEAADFLAIVETGATSAAAPGGSELGSALAEAGATARFAGRANTLSRYHGEDWGVIEEVSRWGRLDDAVEPAAAGPAESFDDFPIAAELLPPSAPRAGEATAAAVILGRRSAIALDGETGLDADAFYRMLARLVPVRGNRALPFDAIQWRPRVHLGLWVHRVEGLAPGLYALVRDPLKLELLRAAMSDFAWQHPDRCPAGLPLYELARGDARALAARVSCDQAIAADGAFAVAMFAELGDAVASLGAPFYRRLFWEAGLIGQVLYLEAEAAGLRGTGIGCYYDAPAGQVFGLRADRFASFYHFTLGGPLEDARLRTLPAYAHLAQQEPTADGL